MPLGQLSQSATDHCEPSHPLRGCYPGGEGWCTLLGSAGYCAMVLRVLFVDYVYPSSRWSTVQRHDHDHQSYPSQSHTPWPRPSPFACSTKTCYTVCVESNPSVPSSGPRHDAAATRAQSRNAEMQRRDARAQRETCQSSASLHLCVEGSRGEPPCLGHLQGSETVITSDTSERDSASRIWRTHVAKFTLSRITQDVP